MWALDWQVGLQLYRKGLKLYVLVAQMSFIEGMNESFQGIKFINRKKRDTVSEMKCLHHIQLHFFFLLSRSFTRSFGKSKKQHLKAKGPSCAPELGSVSFIRTDASTPLFSSLRHFFQLCSLGEGGGEVGLGFKLHPAPHLLQCVSQMQFQHPTQSQSFSKT